MSEAEPESPSLTFAEWIRTIGGPRSLSKMVPVPVPVPISTPEEAPLNCTTTVSSGSAALSPCTATVTVLLASPGANVKVPELSAV